LPADYGMVNMFANVGQRTMTPELKLSRFSFLARYLLPFTQADRRYRPMGHPGREKLKLIFSRIEKPGRQAVPLQSVLSMEAKMTPVAAVDVDAATAAILERSDPGGRSVWGPITMPVF
ncbi:MAG: hypothetical protein HYX74_00260, partial [Acidobacteria bacterium]|nr:hypothetical protein [Acidobacteriota bacterium]